MDLYSAYSLCLGPIVTGLIGLVAGLAIRKIHNFRRFQDILKAVGINAVVIISLFILESLIGYARVIGLIVPFIGGSVLLVILMLVFAKTVRPDNRPEHMET